MQFIVHRRSLLTLTLDDSDRYNKIYSFNIISIILTFLLIITKIRCDKIPLVNLSAGDVISGIDLNDATSVIVGKLFDDNIKSKYVKKNILDYSRTQGYTTVYYCNETDHSNYYPNIIVFNATNNIVNKNNQLNGGFLGIDEGYVNRKYLCGAFKTCDVKIEETVSNDLMKENDLPEEVKLSSDRTGVSTIRREGETYYVSSILKAYCVYQVLVFENPKPSTEVIDTSKENPVQFGRILVSSDNKTLETWVNDYLSNAHQSLRNLDFNNRNVVFKQFNVAAIIDLELKPLPALAL